LNKFSFLLFLLLIWGCGNEKPSPSKSTDTPSGRQVIPEQTLTFLSERGDEITVLNIAVADEQAEREQGLMDVRTMAEEDGMLFIFEEERPLSFWMVNTPLSLDIMYVNTDSTIVRIYQSTTPFSETSMPSDAPARFVVETNAGYALEHGITEGMRIRF
jgi:hypothetical protein